MLNGYALYPSNPFPVSLLPIALSFGRASNTINLPFPEFAYYSSNYSSAYSLVRPKPFPG